MPTVPRSDGPQVTTRPLEIAPVTAEQYGGGNLARAVGGLGDDLMRIQAEADQLALDERDVQAYGEIQQLEREVMTLKGTEAVRVPDVIDSRWGVIESRVLQGVSPRVQEQLRLRMARYRAQLEGSAGRFADTELQRATKSAFEGRTATITERAVRARVDGNADGATEAAQEFEETLARYRDNSRNPYATPEEAEAETAKLRSAFYAAQITGMLAVPEPDAKAALALYDEVKDKLVGDAPQEIQRRLQEADKASRVQAAVTALQAEPDPKRREEMIVALGDVEIERRVRDVFDARTRANENIRKAAEQALFDDVWARVQDPANAGRSLEEFTNADERVRLGTQLLNALRNGADDREDGVVWRGFLQDYATAAGRTRMKAMTMAQMWATYGRRMSDSNRTKMETMWLSLQDETLDPDRVRRASAQVQGILTTERTMEIAAETYGILPPQRRGYNRNEDQEAQRRYNDFRIALDRHVTALSATKGRPLNDEEIREEALNFAARRVMMDNQQAGRLTRGREGNEDVFSFDSSSDAVMALTPEQRMQMYVPQSLWGAPLGMKDEAEAARNMFRRGNVTRFSDFDVAQMVFAMRYNDTDMITALLNKVR